MAIQPSKFTRLLIDGKIPSEIYKNLKRANCLSDDEKENDAQIIAFISKTLKDLGERSAAHERLYKVAPEGSGSDFDQLANIMLQSEYVNENALRLHQSFQEPIHSEKYFFVCERCYRKNTYNNPNVIICAWCYHKQSRTPTNQMPAKRRWWEFWK